eukprot:jgi/Mesen1/9124/ME000058S08619
MLSAKEFLGASSVCLRWSATWLPTVSYRSLIHRHRGIKFMASLQVTAHKLPRNGLFPNSSINGLPLLIYRHAFSPEAEGLGIKLASHIESVFGSHGFPPQWRYGMYPYAHFHSTSHEVLGVYQGSARLRFGGHGQAAVEEEVQPGDVIVIPAGVAHNSVDMRDGFSMVGAYPEGKNWDMCCGKDAQEYNKAEAVIKGLDLPSQDPVFGNDGPLHRHWRK